MGGHEYLARVEMACFDGGLPGRGVHALRIPLLDLAAVDVVGTLLIARACSAFWGGRWWAWALALVAVGEVWHARCGVCTAALRRLGVCGGNRGGCGGCGGVGGGER